VIPRFSRIFFRPQTDASPWPTQIVLTFSQLVRDYWWAGVGAVLLIYFGLKAYTKDEERNGDGPVQLRWMVVGDLIKKLEMARFARTLGPCCQSGSPSCRPLISSKKFHKTWRFRDRARHVHRSTERGKGISKSMEETGVFPLWRFHMISVGRGDRQPSTDVDGKVAEAYEENVRTTRASGSSPC